MKVLFLLIAYPASSADANLYSDLVAEFTARGHRVAVATLSESFDDAPVKQAQGARILRVPCGRLFGVGRIRKGITMLSLPRRFLSAIRRHFPGERFDLVIYPTPPITFAPVVSNLKREQRCGTYLILRDIFPQNARDLGLIREPLSFHYFRRKERQLYSVSDHIGCMSQGNVDYLIAHNALPRDKAEILYNWEKVPNSPPVRDPALRSKYGLDGKFVAVFGGNIGYAQELEFLLELAALYRDRRDITFLVVGKGVAKARFADRAKRDTLDNVRILDQVPREEFNHLLAACDVGLINLDRRFTIPNIPSKTLSYFAAGIPVLAAIDGSTDYGRLLDECSAGLWSITGDLPVYQRNFERLLNDPDLRRRMGQAGFQALQNRFSVEQAYSTIMRHFPPEGHIPVSA